VKRGVPTLIVMVVVMVVGGACVASNESSQPAPTSARPTATEASSPTTTAPPAAPTPPIEIGLRLDRRVDDDATADFERVVQATLTDARGWEQAGFVFHFADEVGEAPFVVVLAEGDEVHELCLPYDVGRRFSCQIGSVVALNADRWRHATPQWTGALDAYRQMLVNHEVGHLLGQHHPEVQCPQAGDPAPVMAQQSTELRGCLPNPWPLAWEVRCAALRLEPVAPGYERDPEPRCGPDGEVRSPA